MIVLIMWMFKPFAGKEPTNLEGRTVAVGNVKVNVRNVIAEGGFSCVYIARDSADASKQYALKHMICNDQDSLDLITKEIKVMLLLKGHPNVVNLVAHTITDTGRMKEALLLMEFCEKSLVNALEDRGGAYFEERQVLLIFRDVCNAVFAMHSQSPPVAHRYVDFIYASAFGICDSYCLCTRKESTSWCLRLLALLKSHMSELGVSFSMPPAFFLILFFLYMLPKYAIYQLLYQRSLQLIVYSCVMEMLANVVFV